MVTTNYIWDDDNLLAEADQADTINAVYTNEPQQYGNLVSSRISGGTSYHHFDALGSTRQLTNAAGSVTDRMTYDAWGNVVNRTGAALVFLLWIGELGYHFDLETGLFSVRERPYEPENGRWTTVDPLWPFLDVDQFLYANNGPITNFDPSGAYCGPPTLTGDDCKDCIKDWWTKDSILKLIYEQLTATKGKKTTYKKGCEPDIRCCASKSKDKACAPCSDDQLLGQLQGTGSTLLLCYERIQDNSSDKALEKCGQLYETLRHELIHLLDRCTKYSEDTKDKCMACICDEIRAYESSGQCQPGAYWYSHPPSWYRWTSSGGCILFSAANSCRKVPECGFATSPTGNELARKARDYYDKCKKSQITPPDPGGAEK